MLKTGTDDPVDFGRHTVRDELRLARIDQLLGDPVRNAEALELEHLAQDDGAENRPRLFLLPPSDPMPSVNMGSVALCCCAFVIAERSRILPLPTRRSSPVRPHQRAA